MLVPTCVVERLIVRNLVRACTKTSEVEEAIYAEAQMHSCSFTELWMDGWVSGVDGLVFHGW